MMAAGCAATRLILGRASPGSDARDRAHYAAYLGAAVARKVPYNDAVVEATRLLRTTPGALDAIKHVARALLTKRRLSAAEVARIARRRLRIPVPARKPR